MPARGRIRRTGERPRLASAAALLLVLLALVAASSAWANGGESGEEPSQSVLTPKLIQEATNPPTGVGVETPEPDLQASRELPHGELGRGEALHLLEAVFAPAVESPGGILDEMPEARFLGDRAAVMRVGEVAAATEGPEIGAKAALEPVLVESSVPLRTEDEDGHEAPVELGLERSEGELQPSNPIIPTGIPTELREGVSLANGDVELTFPEASGERSPSIVNGDSSFYPNVQEDSDLIVAPVAGGVETMTQLRTPQAPRTQIVHLNLPEGAVLKESDQGGVEARANGHALLSMAPPSAVDAAGNSVPMTVAVSGDNVELTVSPEEGTAFPILADPAWTLENWNWTWGGSSFAGWTPDSFAPGYQPLTYQNGTGIPALDVTSGFPGGATPNTGAQWQFWIPRYQSDISRGYGPPQSFISGVFTEGMMFQLEGNHATWPGLLAGIIDTNYNEWVSNFTWTGANGEFVGWSGHANFYNWYEPNPIAGPPHYAEDTNAKVFVYGLITIENEGQAKYRQAVAAKATTEVADHNTPAFTKVEAPVEWRNTGQVPITYMASDAGLGVAGLELVPPGGLLNGSESPRFSVGGCTGVAVNPCPRETGSESLPGGPHIEVNAATAPEGVDHYRLAAYDPLYSEGFSEGSVPHIAESTVALKIDHSPPSVSLSGSLTEQASRGTALPQYTLKYNATDGTENAPTFAANSPEGLYHHPADIVRNSEAFWNADKGNNRIVKVNLSGVVQGTYSAIGSEQLPEQLKEPSGIDSDANGNVWVAATGNNRVVEFNSKGEWVRKIGKAAPGSGNSEFSSPQGIAVAPNGNVWVADTGNNRIQELSPTGVFIAAFGSKGSGNGQFSEPIALAVAPNGNIWIADTGNNRIVKLSGGGEFLASYGSLGSGNGQFNRPVGIQVDSGGSVWVADEVNGRVEQFSENGEFLGQFGARGTGNGQFSFSGASGITTSSAGGLWVVDSGNNRDQGWNAPEGTRSGVRSVLVKIDGKEVENRKVTCPQGGCPLSGEWMLHSGEYAAGAHTVEVTATDGVGLSKTENLNVTLNPPNPTLAVSGTVTQQATLGYTRPGYTLRVKAAAGEGTGPAPGAPSYLSSFGSAGSGNGQFKHPAGIAVDSAGNLWVADVENNRIEEFNGSGTFVKSVGSSGSGPGQFKAPKSIAIDPEGDFWVADSGNNRLEEFNPSWEFIKSVGSAGSGNGQLSGPEGIAIGPEGNIWVADTYNFRVDEFNSMGDFVRVVSGLGAIEPTALAVNDSGTVWVTDSAHNRVVQIWSSATFASSFGTAGAGNDQFADPDAVAIDNSGNLWVGDQGNRRIQEFTQSGEYLAQFGSSGSGAGQFSFSYPMGIATDAKGNLWVSDTGNNRVQRWHHGARSQVTTEITVDGKAIDTSEAQCTTESCPITRELRLESPVGTHTLVVKATDGYGRWASNTRTFKVEADTVKPTLEVGGELASAPEGWVQQERYGLYAIARDPGGYGVTSLLFRIDGTTVASAGKSCPEGGCQALIGDGFSMASYSGGAHEAEVVATDGAGNTQTKRWTINVDPEGHVSTAEATATLEAVEETSESNLVGESKEEGIEGTAEGLGLEVTETGFAATGSAAPMTMGSDPSEPMVVEVPEASYLYSCPGPSGELGSGANEEPPEPGEAKEVNENCTPARESANGGLEPISVTPMKVGEEAATIQLVEENAAVSANTGSAGDTVVRPLDDGGRIFQDIRDDSAPETYSYRVSLAPNQELRQIDATHIQVYYSYGFPSFMISAETAHDAIGTEVPTSIEITREDVVTLTIHYKAGHEGQPFVYPIVGGTGWQGGFISEPAAFGLSGSAPPEVEEGPEEEAWELEQLENGDVILGLMAVGPPEEVEALTTAEASVMEINPLEPHRKARKQFRFDICHPHLVAGDPPPVGEPEWPPGDGGGGEGGGDEKRALMAVLRFHCRDPEYGGNYWRVTMSGRFHYVLHERVWLNWKEWDCAKTGGSEIFVVELAHCEAFFPNGTHYPSGTRFKGPIAALGEFRFPAGFGQFGAEAVPNCLTVGGWIYPNPRKGPSGYYEEPLEYQKARGVLLGEPCPEISL